MRRASRRRSVLAAMAFCLAATSWAAGTTTAAAQISAEDLSAEDLSAEDLTAQALLDLAGVDLIGQTPATASSPATVQVRVAGRLSSADLRVRLYAPVTTRAELLASLQSTPPTALITEWIVEDARRVASNDQGVILSVPIQPFDENMASLVSADDSRPLPLHLEAVNADGAVVGGLATFLTPGADAAGSLSAPPLLVAVILDLRLPPSHLADGGAATDGASLDRVLGLAGVLIERSAVPLSVEMSPETLDALALIGDDTSVTVLRTALHHTQLLATPWTSLDLDDWARAGRLDVILDGMRRSAEALHWAGLEASTVMRSENPLPLRAVRAVTGSETGVTAFVTNASPETIGPFPPVTLTDDPSGGSHLTAQSDPLLDAMLRFPDPELGAQWVLAELFRMAAAQTPDAVIVSAGAVYPGGGWFADPSAPLAISSPLEPTALSLLLDGLDASPSLSPATVDDVLARSSPASTVAAPSRAQRLDPGDFGLYLARRVQVEQRLEAYESFLGDDPFLVAPLRTLLAVSASEHLATGERRDFLHSVDRQVAQGTTGVEFLGRGPITVTGRNATLPVTLVNDRSAPVTVALELTAGRIDLTHAERPVFTLEPGRNDLSVPVEAATSGRTPVHVTVKTPDGAGAIVLTTGTFTARFADAEGLGLLILVWAAAALAVWWRHTLRKRSRDADIGGATVAAPGSVSHNVEASSETGTIPRSGDHTRR